MKLINEHNYEAFLLDFVEGNLSTAETNALFDFLAANPSLQEDFDQIFDAGQLKNADLIQFSRKESLLKDEEWDRVQNLIIANQENVASEQQIHNLNELIKQSEQVQQEHAIFSKLVLEEDKNLQFSRKNVLLHQVALKPNFRWVNYSVGLAASVALFFTVYTFLNQPVGLYTPIGIAADFPEIDNEDSIAGPVEPSIQVAKLDSESKPKEFSNQPTPIDIPTSTGPVAEVAQMKKSAPESLDLEPSSNLAAIPIYQAPDVVENAPLLDLVKQESKAFNASYSWATDVGNKLNQFQKEFRKRDAIEINFFGMQTTIRKPSWMKIRRKN